MKIVLISTYELGHQPFGLASPAAWLRAAGADVTCLDLAVQALDREAIAKAALIAFYVPMHTATRLAVSFIEPIRKHNPQAHLCFYGLYAPMNETYLRHLGVETILGGEFETGLGSLYHRLAMSGSPRSQNPDVQPEPTISWQKQKFMMPDRSTLPTLSKYAFLDLGDDGQRQAGYTEASRGCKHHCRHCPIVPVYAGHFRIVQREVVLADIRQQVAAGARHITFGDPDFLNGPRHALPLLKALHQAFPDLTYDVTIKIEHLLKHANQLSVLKETGCLFITSAVEAVDDAILDILDKGHTRADFIQAVALCREMDILLSPTFVAFNPWITLKGYLDLLKLIADLNLVEHVAPIQYAIRLLIPAQSKLLAVPSVQSLVDPYDEKALVYPWSHFDPRVDALQRDVLHIVQSSEAQNETRTMIFTKIWRLAQQAYAAQTEEPLKFTMNTHKMAARFIPRLSEPWYC